jgi:hypothetical protein
MHFLFILVLSTLPLAFSTPLAPLVFGSINLCLPVCMLAPMAKCPPDRVRLRGTCWSSLMFAVTDDYWDRFPGNLI